jgi:hypothetical protein
MEVRSAIERSDVLQHMKFIGTLPHTAAPQYFGVPEPRAELCMDVDAGKISARRVSIPALAVLIREATR